jgi:hypothetical protein
LQKISLLVNILQFSFESKTHKKQFWNTQSLQWNRLPSTQLITYNWFTGYSRHHIIWSDHSVPREKWMPMDCNFKENGLVPFSCIFCGNKENTHQTMIRTTSVQIEIHTDIIIKNCWEVLLRHYKYVCKTEEIVLHAVQDNFSKPLQ